MPPLALELCAGSAKLTRALRKKGLGASGVDHKSNRHKAVAPILVLDLTTQAGQEVVWSALRSGRVVVVSMGPPCGTGSRARELAVPEDQRGDRPPPRPLRGEGFVLESQVEGDG